MAKDNKVRMPSSMAGITQYFDSATSKFTLSPKQVLILIALVILLVAALHMFTPV